MSPSRFETPELQDAPKINSVLWHSLLWSYDRQPYMAEFMNANNLKSLICSHSAPNYHHVTTFVMQANEKEGYKIHANARTEEDFQAEKEFFNDEKN